MAVNPTNIAPTLLDLKRSQQKIIFDRFNVKVKSKVITSMESSGEGEKKIPVGNIITGTRSEYTGTYPGIHVLVITPSNGDTEKYLPVILDGMLQNMFIILL